MTAVALGARRSIQFVGGDGLFGLRIGAEGRPVTFFLDLLVRNRAFHHQDEGFEPAFFREIPVLKEVVAVFIGEHGIVQVHLGQAGDGAQQDIFNAGLSCRGNRNGIAVTAEAGCDPDYVYLRDGRWMLRDSTVRNCFRCHSWVSFRFSLVSQAIRYRAPPDRQTVWRAHAERDETMCQEDPRRCFTHTSRSCRWLESIKSMVPHKRAQPRFLHLGSPTAVSGISRYWLGAS